jgi:2-amino-4-hydroxy-6-hydroxymethyldihydropteridine diphosphokinase
MKTMSSVIAYIGLGSNLAEPCVQLRIARLAIQTLPQVEEVAFSSLYQSPPMGPQDQPDYVNAVMAIRTDLSAMNLLCALQKIEIEQGRVRQRRWGERTLDLDILLYGEAIIQQPELNVPHSGLHERAFVLYPLQEIAPFLTIPLLGDIAALVALCPQAGLEKLT